MLKATEFIHQYARSKTTNNLDFSIYLSLIEAINNYGSKEDAQILLDLFLENPTDYRRVHFLSPIQIHGDIIMAQQIFKNCFSNNQLKEGFPSEIIGTLGYLSYEPIQSVALYYYLSDINQNINYYIYQEACICLLHFSCEDYKKQIHGKIEDCLGKTALQFYDFAPALTGKTTDEELPNKMYKLGKSLCSASVNVGCILGIAFSGRKDLFKQILWDEDWEATDRGGTGTGYWTFLGMHYLEITYIELWNELITIADSISIKEIEYRLKVIEDLLLFKIDNKRITPLKFIIINNKKETYQDIYINLFSHSTNSLSKINDFIKKYFNGLEDKQLYLLNRFDKIKLGIILRMEREIELMYYQIN